MDMQTGRGTKTRATQEAERRELAQQAAEAARMLSLLGNANRLLILCYLMTQKEMNVGELVEAVDLSQSALSQHLTKLRADGLVTFRRDSQHVYYRIADPRVGKLIKVLKKLYCDDMT
jgi:ArsR family transcriptional regulator, virulence genes transcriptional regulator